MGNFQAPPPSTISFQNEEKKKMKSLQIVGLGRELMAPLKSPQFFSSQPKQPFPPHFPSPNNHSNEIVIILNDMSQSILNPIAW